MISLCLENIERIIIGDKTNGPTGYFENIESVESVYNHLSEDEYIQIVYGGGKKELIRFDMIIRIIYKE
jgi:hypothetical protein